MKKNYVCPLIEVIKVEINNIVCASSQTGRVDDWTLDNDDSGSDDWGND
ncbi:MAG: hypothetical protein ACTTKN_09005 [Phocaeicola sp.]|nr:hypothetical protein [Phocaeicola oris]MCE2615373.1 hypothetical protein [Phocaeicola oris]